MIMSACAALAAELAESSAKLRRTAATALSHGCVDSFSSKGLVFGMRHFYFSSDLSTARAVLIADERGDRLIIFSGIGTREVQCVLWVSATTMTRTWQRANGNDIIAQHIDAFSVITIIGKGTALAQALPPLSPSASHSIPRDP